MKRTVFLIFGLLSACQPPAADNYAERGEPVEKVPQASDPLPSPNTDGAVWAMVPGQDKLLYGKPGKPPLFAIACVETAEDSAIRFTRYSPADEGAKAFMALIGNGHVGRFKVDATPVGVASLWQGETPIDDDRLEVLTGRNAVEATIPGAGSMKLNASGLPGQLIEACRAEARAKLSETEVPEASAE